MPGYFTHVPRGQHTNTTARGGGVAITHKSNIKMTSKSSWIAKSFENIEVTLSSSSETETGLLYIVLLRQRETCLQLASV